MKIEEKQGITELLWVKTDFKNTDYNSPPPKICACKWLIMCKKEKGWIVKWKIFQTVTQDNEI